MDFGFSGWFPKKLRKGHHLKKEERATPIKRGHFFELVLGVLRVFGSLSWKHLEGKSS